MPYDDIDTSTSEYSPCTAVTLTPLRDDGLPDHGHTTTHTFDPPITLAYAHRTRLPTIGAADGDHDEPAPPLVGFTAAVDHPDPEALERFARQFRQLDDGFVAVEIQTPREEGPDLFLLFARWQPAPEDSWPQIDPGAPSALLAVGKARSARTPHPWPGLEGGVQAGNTAVLFLYAERPTSEEAA